MRITALINQKGGCGKTTTAVNLSACLAHHGEKVLLIDMDPQGHASMALGVSPEEIPLGMASVLTGEASLNEVSKELHTGFDLAPSNLRLAALEQQLAGLPQREERLLQALRNLQSDYDLILIDAPPSLGLLSFNALRVADRVLIPVDSSTFALHGLDRLLETIELVQTRTGQPIEILALPTLFSRTRFAREMLETLTQRVHGRRAQTVIRNNVRLREAARRGLPILQYDADAIGAQDYEALAQEMITRETNRVRGIRDAAVELAPGFSPLGAGAVFTWPGSDVVNIAGEFNDWVPDRKVFPLSNENGRVQKWLPLAPGRYAYRLRINGIWQEDPFNSRRVDSPIAGKDSLLELSDDAFIHPLEERSTAGVGEG
jgi:chromosome partitioning protein